MTPQETFKTSHKRLTSYHDVIEGGHEQALDGYNMGEVAALHVYYGGLHIIEQFPEDIDGVPEPFHLCLCRDCYSARTLEELELRLCKFWLVEHLPDLRKDTLEDAAIHPENYTREHLILLLQANDRNGEYTDDHAEANDRAPLTKAEAMQYIWKLME